MSAAAVVSLSRDRATTSPTAKPLSPARANLVAANAALAAVRAEIARLSEPASRLHTIRRDLTAEQQKFAALKAADDRRLGEWLTTGGEGPRPEPDAELPGVERRIIELTRDAAAVESVQPGLEQAVAAAASRGAAVSITVDVAFWAVVAEAAAELIDQEFIARLKTMLECEAVIVSLFDVLRFSPAAGNGSSPAHLVAELISKKRQEAKQNTGVPRSTAAGEAFLARLRADPRAELK